MNKNHNSRFRKCRRIFLILVAFSTLAACGGGTRSYEYDEFADPSGKHVFIKTSVDCESASSDQCSPSVGMMVSRSNDKHFIERCTGFLRDDGVWVTNDHCVPRRFQAGSSCYKDIEVFFPNNGEYPRESARCGNIIWRSNDSYLDHDPLVVDMAYIRLTTDVQRPRLQFSHEGVQKLEALNLFSVNPSFEPHVLKGTLVKRACKVTEEATPFKTEYGTKGSIISLSNDYSHRSASCEIVEGNSGSPLVSQENRAVGIIHHGLTENSVSRSSSQYIEPRTPSQSISRAVAWATDFKCQMSPADTFYVTPATCQIPGL